MAYLDLSGFTSRSIMPPDEVTQIEALYPGFTLGRLTYWSSKIDARLRKRYQAPFASPYPEIILGWLTDIVTLDLYLRRGFNPSSAQDQIIEGSAKKAQDELKEAADAKEGLFDLPVREDLQSSAVVSGGPLAYSEASPYRWTDLEAENARFEDENP